MNNIFGENSALHRNQQFGENSALHRNQQFLELLELIAARIGQILKRLPNPRPVEIVLGPEITVNSKGEVMANQLVIGKLVKFVAIHEADDSGAIVPSIMADTFNAASSDTTNVAVSIENGPATTALAGMICLKILSTPAAVPTPGITATVTDADGLSAGTYMFDLVADSTPKSIVLDAAGAIDFDPTAV